MGHFTNAIDCLIHEYSDRNRYRLKSLCIYSFKTLLKESWWVRVQFRCSFVRNWLTRLIRCVFLSARRGAGQWEAREAICGSVARGGAGFLAAHTSAERDHCRAGHEGQGCAHLAGGALPPAHHARHLPHLYQSHSLQPNDCHVQVRTFTQSYITCTYFILQLLSTSILYLNIYILRYIVLVRVRKFI